MPSFAPDQIRIHPELDSVYSRIESASKRGRKHEGALWKSLETSLGRIRRDAQWGEVIPRIPAYFLERYGVPNLYCMDLAFFHRLFYTIFRRDVVLLDVVDHVQYDKWFGRRHR